MILWERIQLCAKISYLVYKYGKKFEIPMGEVVENQIPFLRDISQQTRCLVNSLTLNHSGVRMIDFVDDDVTDLQCVILYHEETTTLIVVFRGSESLTDWYHNLAAFQHTYRKGCRVHGGYWWQLHNNNAFAKVYSIIKCKAREHDDLTLLFTGHSAGSALATLATFFVAKDFPRFQFHVVGFGGPRVGNKGFRDDFAALENVQAVRVSNNRDIVTAIPCIRYHHVAHEIWFDSRSGVWYDEEEERERKQVGWFSMIWHRSLIFRRSITDHDMQHYLRIMEAKKLQRTS